MKLIHNIIEYSLVLDAPPGWLGKPPSGKVFGLPFKDLDKALAKAKSLNKKPGRLTGFYVNSRKAPSSKNAGGIRREGI